jgi:hypothetical protein
MTVDSASIPAWTCARCEVTSRWMPGHERQEHPPNWQKENGSFYCLACQRERAGEAALFQAPAGITAQRHAQIRTWAVVEFEIERDPDRSNGEIARVVRSSIPAVVKARQRLRARSSR